jgi:hypothetical protein
MRIKFCNYSLPFRHHRPPTLQSNSVHVCTLKDLFVTNTHQLLQLVVTASPLRHYRPPGLHCNSVYSQRNMHFCSFVPGYARGSYMATKGPPLFGAPVTLPHKTA